MKTEKVITLDAFDRRNTALSLSVEIFDRIYENGKERAADVFWAIYDKVLGELEK